MPSKSLIRTCLQDSETQIKEKIIKWLKKNVRRAFVYKIADRWRAGIPDILIVYMGHVIFIEVKKPGEDMKPKQEHTAIKLKEAGAIVAVVHSVDELEIFASNIFLIEGADDDQRNRS